MPEKKPDNIFDAAGKAYSSGKKKKNRAAAESSSEASAPEQESNVPASSRSMSTEELYKITKARHEDLKAQGQKALERAGVDSERLSRYLSNPSNFTPRAWQALEKQRDEEERALAARVGRAAMKASEDDKHLQKGKKQRRKFLGARRNWLKMD